MSSATLPAATRERLDQVARAVLVNPFGPAREAADEALAGASHRAPGALDRVLAQVGALLADLDPRAAWAPEDRERVELAWLFDTYHRFSGAFDAHIQAQATADDPLPVAFAGDLLGRLTATGTPPERAEHLLGLFFQMHRAYHFIDGGLIGISAPMRRLRAQLWDNLFTSDLRRYDRRLHFRMEDFSTILLGETGSGKGAAAAALGRSGYIPWDPRRGAFATSFARAFVEANLSEFPETLVESALFGHRRGAFTGAVADQVGLFGRCDAHGALFLDEIAELAGPIQVKLLRVLQERRFTPLGATSSARFAGRVITATHQPLAARVAEGRFRADLYYRLCADVIEVPSLRARLADAPAELDALVAALLARVVGAPQPDIAGEVAAVVRRDRGPSDAWPGNVRELEQAVRQVLLRGHAAPPSPPRAAGAALLSVTEELAAEDVLARYCAALYARHGNFEQVARIVGLDRRTVKKHVTRAP